MADPALRSPSQSQGSKGANRARRASPSTEERESEGHWASGCLPDQALPGGDAAAQDGDADDEASSADREAGGDKAPRQRQPPARTYSVRLVRHTWIHAGCGYHPHISSWIL